MDDLSKRLRALNNDLPVPEATTFSMEILKSRMQPDAQTISFYTLRNAAAIAMLIVLANISVMIWSGHKDANVALAHPPAAYLQTYNLSIY